MFKIDNNYLENKYFVVGLLSLVLFCVFSFLSLEVMAMSDGENQKIEKILIELNSKTSLIFIRNGKEYNSEDAVAHLKRKLKNVASKINSAEEFIDNVASTSSWSGEAYLYKESSESEPKPIRDYLHWLLKNQE
jgi:hypothetical protein